ncbi:hypothetical protein GCM10023176_61210 [Micromonospora coerulea]|uniref:DUF3618 domain-containing protein n=1 Tax=Micromonospora coerulea TaxID=47856 RepID=A0ABP8T886_9ACTN|nr:hypothetical protein [Micromonospora veneta]
MTYDLSPTSSTRQESNNGGGVRDQARQVGSETANAGGAVAQTAKEQGQEVVGEAKRQARNLYGEARYQVAAQTSQQQQRAAGGLRSLAEEMRSMAQNSGQSGPVSELAHQAADRVHGVAGWLEQREPGDILREVKTYARRNPGTFLIGAAVLGVLAGRLTKNIAAAGDEHGTAQRAYGTGYDPDRTAVIPTSRAVPDQVPPGGYLDPTPGSYADPQTSYAEPGGYTDPTRGGYAEPQTGTGQPLPPVSQTDPLPGVPSSGVTRP